MSRLTPPFKWGYQYSDHTHKTNEDLGTQIIRTRQMGTPVLRLYTLDKWGPQCSDYTHKTNGDPSTQIIHTRQMGTTVLRLYT